MIITSSGKITFEPLKYEDNEIKKARLFITKFPDAAGILYKITTVLFVHNWNIISAEIHTVNNIIEDEFILEPYEFSHINKNKLEKMERDILSLLLNQIRMSEYLSRFEHRTQVLIDNMKPYDGTKLDFEILKNPKMLQIYLETKDRQGILYFLSHIFFLAEYSVLDFKANTTNGFVQDTFIIQKTNLTEFNEKDLKEIEFLIRKFI